MSMYGLEVLGPAVLCVCSLLICMSAMHRYRVLVRRAERRRRIQAAAESATALQRTLHGPGEPLPAEVQESLPKTKFRADSPVPEDRTCSICLMEYEEDDELCTLPCKHTYHSDCVGAWFSSHSTCPFCRLSLLLPDGSSGQNYLAGVDSAPSEAAITIPDALPDDGSASSPGEASHPGGSAGGSSHPGGTPGELPHAGVTSGDMSHQGDLPRTGGSEGDLSHTGSTAGDVPPVRPEETLQGSVAEARGFGA